MIESGKYKTRVGQGCHSVQPMMHCAAVAFNQAENHYQEKQAIELDTAVSQLSSRKLWHVLRLSEIPGCQVDSAVIEEVKAELKVRGDYSLENPWKLPH